MGMNVTQYKGFTIEDGWEDEQELVTITWDGYEDENCWEHTIDEAKGETKEQQITMLKALIDGWLEKADMDADTVDRMMEEIENDEKWGYYNM
jgi:hypothetical protein